MRWRPILIATLALALGALLAPAAPASAASGAHAVLRGVAMQPGGKIVAAGYACCDRSGHYNFALARYKPNGRLDKTFGTDGRVTTDIGTNSQDLSRAMAIDNSGRIVVVGTTDRGPPNPFGGFTLVRYTRNGKLDRTFGHGGKVVTGFGSFADAVEILGSGRILTAGYASVSGAGGLPEDDFALARFRADGSFDPSFGSGGKVVTSFGTASAKANALALGPGGTIVAAGQILTFSLSQDFAVARYEPNGALDGSFGSGGTVVTNFGGGSIDRGRAVAIQPSGRIVVAGQGGGEMALAGYQPDGELDPGFGQAGLVTQPGVNGALALTLDQPGGLLAAGWSCCAGSRRSDFAVARFDAGGRLDPAFGVGGVVRTDFKSGGSDIAHSISLDGRGRIIVGGDSGRGGKDFAIARYKPSGALDPSFGHRGEVTTRFAPPLPTTRITSARISPAKRKAAFSFTGSGVGFLEYQCRLDGAKFEPCAARKRQVYRGLRPGEHSFAVRTEDVLRAVDPTPAKRRFRI